jgi:hypothetical protein
VPAEAEGNGSAAQHSNNQRPEIRRRCSAGSEEDNVRPRRPTAYSSVYPHAFVAHADDDIRQYKLAGCPRPLVTAGGLTAPRPVTRATTTFRAVLRGDVGAVRPHDDGAPDGVRRLDSQDARWTEAPARWRRWWFLRRRSPAETKPGESSNGLMATHWSPHCRREDGREDEAESGPN